MVGRGRTPFLHLPVPWVFVLAYLLGEGLQLLLPVRPPTGALAPATLVGGGVLFVAGAVVAGWGLLTFRRAATTTVPGEKPARLVTEGPYQWTRNPMYVGLLVAYLGEAGLLAQVWPLLPLLLVLAYVQWFVIPVEEASLAAFGADYQEYRARVRRWI
jgi:protein-S-isoprenylcysteine O-methyltransferase Ste14